MFCLIVGAGMEKVNSIPKDSPAAPPKLTLPLFQARSAHTYPRSTFGCIDESQLLRSSFREWK